MNAGNKKPNRSKLRGFLSPRKRSFRGTGNSVSSWFVGKFIPPPQAVGIYTQQTIKKRYGLATKEQLRQFLLSSENTIPIDEAIRRARKQWQK